MITIIDAGTVMNTSILPKLEADLIIPQSVMNEIKSQQAKHVLQLLVSKNQLAVVESREKDRARIQQVATEMGQNKLSDADIDVLAIALQYSKRASIQIITDDYGVRNVAHELNIPSKGTTTSGGEQKRKYKYQCRACGRFYKQQPPDCDICGHTKFKRYRR